MLVGAQVALGRVVSFRWTKKVVVVVVVVHFVRVCIVEIVEGPLVE